MSNKCCQFILCFNDGQYKLIIIFEMHSKLHAWLASRFSCLLYPYHNISPILESGMINCLLFVPIQAVQKYYPVLIDNSNDCL